MSPFKVNQVIQISAESTARAISEFANNKRAVNLILGHQAQYEHDVAFLKAGIPFTISNNRAPLYDREVNGLWQDDKVATWQLANGAVANKPSFSHTISYHEHVAWSNQLASGKDVIIHSFEYVNPEYLFVIYKGSIKFSEVLKNIKIGSNSYYFERGILN